MMAKLIEAEYGPPARHRRQRARDRIRKRRAAEHARQHANDGDADLHGREKAAGVALQLERHLRAGAAQIGGVLQPRLARRDDRHLGKREEAVDENEQKDDGELQPQHGFLPARGPLTRPSPHGERGSQRVTPAARQRE